MISLPFSELNYQMRKPFLFLLLIPFLGSAQNHITKFELSNGNQTPTYPEIISWWKALDAASPLVKMEEMGPTDAGYPLHLVLVSADKNFSIASNKAKGRTIIFVLNGIH